jgi:integrase
VYANHLRRGAADERGLTHRLLGSELAPNSQRTAKAALAAWALFSRDRELAEQLKDLRLPPARRMKAKIPLELEAWRRFVQHVTRCKMRCEPIRHVELIIAKRGIRCSDVLRMSRQDVTQAVATKVLVFEGKGRKRTRFAAAPILEHLEALAEIKHWKHVSDLISSGSPRAALTRVERAVRRHAEAIDLPDVFPHRFRTTYATSFLKALQGDPQALIKLQRHMDWESLATAARYADAVDAGELDVIGAGLTESLTQRTSL